MFAAPPEITARVVATVPEALAGRSSQSEWLRNQHRGRAFRAFLEGPAFGPDGHLYCVDIAHGRILRVSPEDEFEVVIEYDGEPNGLAFHKDGRLFVADHRNGIMVLDVATRVIAPVITRPGFERFRGVNDLHFASNGDLYFSDQGQSGLQSPHGRLFRYRASGEFDCLLDNIPSPNGVLLNEHETDVIVAVTRANAVWRLRLRENGQPGKCGLFIQLSGGLAGPDGMALADDGSLTVCHMGFGTVWLFSRLGEPLLRIRSPAGLLTSNCAFGGPDRRTLYITEAESASILSVDLPVTGMPLYGG